MKLLLAFLIGLLMGAYPEVSYDILMNLNELWQTYVAPKMVQYK